MAPAISPPLNEVQLMLLRLFSRPIPGQDLTAIREMLLSYYETLLQNELETIIETKGISDDDFEKLLTEDQRTR